VAARFTALGFAVVELDPAGYRRGGLLTLASPAGE
jgi:PP-loop superfamily ATP-utilizing enzyme